MSETRIGIHISALPEQKALLAEIGESNVSEGFRRVCKAAAVLRENVHLLDSIGELVMVHGSEEQIVRYREIMSYVGDVAR